MFDINLFSIRPSENGNENPLPGLMVLTAPRKSARGRELDTLVLLASIEGSGGISAESLNAWLFKKSSQFFQTAGTVTFAVKSFVESLNTDLLERNLKRAKRGERLSAGLNLFVLRRNTLYLANFGKARAWFINSTESVEFMDSDNQGRGLGLNEKIICTFATREVASNDLLLFSCRPPELWKAETFKGCSALANDVVGRRLFNQTGPELNAAMIRFTEGKGLINQAVLSNPLPALVRKESPSATPQSVDSQGQVVREGKTQDIADTNAASEPSLEKPIVISSLEPGKSVNETGAPLPAGRTAAREETVTASVPEKVETANPSELQKAVGKPVKKAADALQKTRNWFYEWMHNVLPGIAEEPMKLQRNALIAIAVGVPLVIALIAGAVYVKIGKSRQFDQNLVMAQQYAMQAEVQAGDAPMRLASLQQSLFWLDKAEEYGSSEESASLRVKVQGTLDELQGVQRLEMVEVTPGGLKAGAKVTQMVATATDLYLLDSDSGMVRRYVMGSSGYEPDEAFECGPNPDNPLNPLSAIVDILPLNVNNTFKATLLALDESGNTEFCIPGDAGVTSSLIPPDQGWKKLTAAAIDDNYLYILDSNGRAVYRYERNGIELGSKPTLYFDNQIPTLTDVIDIEINGDELYLLRNNGQMVECTYSHMKDYKLTECQDPAPYGDMRSGQSPEPISFPEANFIQMRLTTPPDSSIYLLDANTMALYHFSLQRNLQKILHPRDVAGTDLERLKPTAVAISSARTVFMAFGSQIYYAQMP